MVNNILYTKMYNYSYFRKYAYFFLFQKIFFQEPRLLVQTLAFLNSSFLPIIPFLTRYFSKDLNRVAIKINFFFPSNSFFFKKKNLYLNWRLLRFGLNFNKFNFSYLNRVKNFFFFREFLWF